MRRVVALASHPLDTHLYSEAIALVADQGHRPAEKRELHTSVKSFGFGACGGVRIAPPSQRSDSLSISPHRQDDGGQHCSDI